MKIRLISCNCQKNANANLPEAAKFQNSIFLPLQVPPPAQVPPRADDPPFPPPLRDVSVAKKELVKFWKSTTYRCGSRKLLVDSSALQHRVFSSHIGSYLWKN